MPQAVVHVAKDHQRQGPVFADLADGFLQVLITPITGRAFPITAAGIGGITAQPSWTAVGQQNQRTVGWCLQSSSRDALRRLKQAELTPMGQHRWREIKTAACTAWAATHHREGSWIQLLEGPAAVQVTQGLFHARQGAATGIASGIVVAQHTSHRQLQLPQQPRQAHIAIGQIAHHQQGIGLEDLQQRGIGLVPLTVEISSDGKSQHRPARRRFYS